MAIEKMTMMNVVGLMEYVDDVAKEIILLENVDVVNALNEIKESHFTLSVVEKNVNELIDMSMIRPFHDEENYEDVLKKINTLKEIFKEDIAINRSCIAEHYEIGVCCKRVDDLYNTIMDPYNEIQQLKDEVKEIDEYKKNFSQMKDLSIDIDKLKKLHYFTYTFGVLSKDDRERLKKNYENISAIVTHAGSSEDGEVYLVISPRELEVETKRILRSLNFHEIVLPDEFSGNTIDIVKNLEERRKKVAYKLKKLSKSFAKLKEDNKEVVEICFSRIKIQEKVKEVKNHMVATKNFFYFSGWIPEKDKEKIRSTLEKYRSLIIMFKGLGQEEKSFTPPTKLRNNRLFSPFEYLVKMYGTPSYNEIDPTFFLGLTYMLLFGVMFGDVGQGFVLFLGGWLLKKRSSNNPFGPILNRLGISSMIFGFLYGSIFGFEHVIPELLIKPFENINTILGSSVMIGVLLLLVSHGYSITNFAKQKDLKEGLFGRNGVTGLIFYALLLILGVGAFTGKSILPISAIAVILLVLVVIMIIKEPLANLIIGKRPLYHEDKSSYYIESSFDILETLLSMLSSTVSFIRVGAFALTHVGLFIAFETIANLMNNFAGSVFILILGNVIIISLEGLIVGIQVLRLEYYELFSKYYRGEGKDFNPARLT